MSKCKVCSKYSKNNPHTKFFRFPKDSYRCALWANKCNLFYEYSKTSASYFNKTYRICSDHFIDNFIQWDGQRAKLKPGAVPTVFNNVLRVNASNENKNVFVSISSLNNCIESNIDGYNADFQLEIMDRLCRFCAVEHSNLTMLFGAYAKSLDLPTKIKYIPIKLSENDVMPTKICQECIKKVEQGYLFVQHCVETDEKLRTFLDMADKNTSYDKITCNTPDNTSTNRNIESEINSGKPGTSSAIIQIAPQLNEMSKNPSNLLREIDFSGSLALQNDYAGMFLKTSDLKVKAPSNNNNKKEIATKKNNQIQFPCHYCHRNFQTLEIMTAHAKAHFLSKDNNGNFSCDECHVSFRNRFHLSSHIRRHFNEKPYVCIQCSGRFYNSSLLRQHALTHSPKQFSCDICKKEFSRKNKLSIHIQESKHFYGQESPTELLKRADYKCVACIKSFSKLSSLERHWKIHWPVSKFLCAFCGKLFTRMDSLTKHYRIHTGERPYSCYVCGFSFKQRGDCKKHEDNH